MEESKQAVVMTPEMRASIFSKEVLTINDMAAVLSMTYGGAAKVIREIRRKYDRLGVEGRIHIMDYFDYFKIPIEGRYGFNIHVVSNNKTTEGEGLNE